MTSRQEELPPLKILLTQLEWNLDWLRQMEKNEPTDYFRDAALQRFEFTFQTALKCIRGAALQHGGACETPEECFSLAVRKKWFAEPPSWKKMLQDYQKMKEGTDPENTRTVLAQLHEYREGFQNLYDRLAALAPKS